MAKIEKKEKEVPEIFVTKVEEGTLSMVLVGTSPLILNKISEKAKRELLFPRKKSKSERGLSLKHDPLEEYRSSPHRLKDGKTLLAIPCAAPKKAIASAALDLPGSSKAEIGRLLWVPGEYLPVYGTPQLFMAIVRNSDMNRTPDIRTRAIVKEWVIPFSVKYVRPNLNETVIVNLMNAAGLFIGIGDGRNQKGCFSYGQFRVLATQQAAKDPEVQRIMLQNRVVQVEAMANPDFYDDETEELYKWFSDERSKRGKNEAQPIKEEAVSA